MKPRASFALDGLHVTHCPGCTSEHTIPWPRVSITRMGPGRRDWGWRAVTVCPYLLVAFAITLDVNLFVLAHSYGAVDAGYWDGDGAPERVMGRVSA